jgi:ankyrin repeat protein
MFRVIEYLCRQRNAFVSVEDSQSQSPLMTALFAGHTACARLLIQYRADVNTFNCFGENSIWVCIVTQRSDLLMDFIKNSKIDLNVKLERHQNTLLHKLVLMIEGECQRMFFVFPVLP